MKECLKGLVGTILMPFVLVACIVIGPLWCIFMLGRTTYTLLFEPEKSLGGGGRRRCL